jgi:hypothetical protein
MAYEVSPTARALLALEDPVKRAMAELSRQLARSADGVG